jgi:hypothetical protein
VWFFGKQMQTWTMHGTRTVMMKAFEKTHPERTRKQTDQLGVYQKSLQAL